jgi:hypothetical protein
MLQISGLYFPCTATFVTIHGYLVLTFSQLLQNSFFNNDVNPHHQNKPAESWP